MNLQMVGGTMQTVFSGNTDSKFRAGDDEYDINTRYENFNRKSIEDVRNLLFFNDQGQQIQLSSLPMWWKEAVPASWNAATKALLLPSMHKPLGDLLVP